MGLINRFNRVTARLAKVKSAPTVGAGPILSITFDDFPRSALIEGGPIVTAAGGGATYYTAGRFCAKTINGIEHYRRSDLREAIDAGHEIGCHTYSHKRGTHISSAELRDDCARNVEFLQDALPDCAFESFAYPYGDVSVRVKGVAGRRYATARGIRPRVNVSPLDLALLHAAPLDRLTQLGQLAIEALAAETARCAGWLILFSHDVSDDPTPLGCTSAMLIRALEISRRRGLEVLTVGAATRRLLSPSLDRAA